MTQAELDFSAPETVTATPRRHKVRLSDKLEAYLRAHEGQFVRVADMAVVVGTSGVRERRRECEQRGVVLQRNASGKGEYRGGYYGFVVLGYVPASVRAGQGTAA
jgi:hypothetical protein